jgi:peptide/nickel transport system permease protein
MSNRLKALLYYVLTRLLLAPVMLWTIATLVFLLMRATPGDPVDAILGPRAPTLRLKMPCANNWACRVACGINICTILNKLIHFDLGTSLTTRGQPTWEIIQSFFPATAELAIYSMLVAASIGLGVGILAALKKIPAGICLGACLGLLPIRCHCSGLACCCSLPCRCNWAGFRSVPVFRQPSPHRRQLRAYIRSMHCCAVNWLQFITSCHYLILPAFSLGIVLSGIFERIVRVSLQETLRSDYVEAAIARGIKGSSVLINHALKNAMIPVVTILG